MAFRAAGQPRSARRTAAVARWPRRVVPVLVTILAAVIALCLLVGVWTDVLWFQSVGHAGTFAVTFGTKWALFAVAAAFMTAVVGGNAWLAWRLRPDEEPAAEPHSVVAAYRLVIDPHRRLLLAVALVITGLISGTSAAGSWRTWLLFANRTSFGRVDPQFHLDISFFVFDYPFIRLVLTYLFAAVLVSFAVATVVHLLYGGLTPQRRGGWATSAARVQLFVLAGTFVLLKAAAYWVDRYEIDFSSRGVMQTGASYTDVNAILPAKTVLAVIALICAVLFLVGAAQRRPMLPAIGLGLLVLSAVLIGGVYPAIIQQFMVKPNELTTESPFLAKEIAGTRQAYGVAGVGVAPYPAVVTQSAAGLTRAAAALPDLRIADPGVLSPAFQQLQQVKSYYKFAPMLSVDRYSVPGGTVRQDMIIGARAMSGPPPGQANWVNTHLVYTHGYGLVAAAAGTTAPSGSPDFTESNIPETDGTLPRFQPRIYFGEQQDDGYVIAGGLRQHELDYPDDAAGGGQRDSTYHGGGGVAVGSPLSRLLYAIKFRQLNILLSSAINGSSRILYVRSPLERVAKVAPFLTLDRDVYPVAAGGQLYWVVDGYTTSDDYPYSARLGLGQVTAGTYQPGGGVTGADGQVNYIRNSVKALVNAYTGQVTLYQWREGGGQDPVLAAWRKAFPGLIRPQAAIPPALLPHLRYPEALFAAQRQILSQFHETNAAAFYGGQDFWSVPADPATGSHGRLSQPPYYLTMTMPGQTTPHFSLVTSFTQRGRPNMAAYMAVDSDPGPGYGRIQILELPQNAGIAGPQQADNDFQSDAPASIELTQLRKGGSKVTFGNLVTVPFGGSLLYTQPVYVSGDAAGGAGSYPALKRVFAYFDDRVGYAPTLQGALAQALGTASGQPASPPGSLRRYLQQAQDYYAAALSALRADDLATYASDLAKMNAALRQAARLAGVPGPGTGGAGPGTPGSSASPPAPASPSPSASGKAGR